MTNAQKRRCILNECKASILKENGDHTSTDQVNRVINIHVYMEICHQNNTLSLTPNPIPPPKIPLSHENSQ